jgi:uncharacterized protein YkwD
MIMLNSMRKLHFPPPARSAAIRQNAGLLILAAMLASAQPALAAGYGEVAQNLVSNLPAGARFRDDLEAQLLREANGLRTAKGVGTLSGSRRLQVAARAQAVDMMRNNFVGHRATSGQDFESRMRSFVGNPMAMPRMAENAARETQKGEADAAKATRLFQQWVGSRGHRKTLLNATYTHVSTGVVQSGNKIWAVQIFWSGLPDEAKQTEQGAGVY